MLNYRITISLEVTEPLHVHLTSSTPSGSV